MTDRSNRFQKVLCNIHKTKVVQLGSCLTCSNKATICETKGCINFHEENQRMHNVLTLEQIRHIVTQYVNSNIEKRAYLKKMVYEYFTMARKQVERLFTQVYDSIDNFVFDDLIFHEDDRRLIEMLKNEQYENFTCEQIAIILPKLIKTTDYEDGHFTHLRNYLISEKQKVQSQLNAMLLNLPEFRWKSSEQNVYKFHQITEDSLKDVNTQLINLTHRPKKLRIKYGHCTYMIRQTIEGQKVQFVRLMGSLENLKDLQAFELYSVWDIDENQFQTAVIEALTNMHYLKEISIYTSFKVTSTQKQWQIAAIYRSRSSRKIGHFDIGIPYTYFIPEGTYVRYHKKAAVISQQLSRQSYQSLDKVDKRHYASKIHTSLPHKKNVTGLRPNPDEKYGKMKVSHEEWPPSNKRRYLKNYQLPKLNSPLKNRKEQISKYQGETNEDLLEDEQKMVIQKKSFTLELSSPTKRKLIPIKSINYPYVVRTKAGTTGKQTKINQDVAIVEEKFPHGIKLYCVCDGHGLNGHLVTAFIKTNLIKNLNGPLRKYHNPPDRQKFVELVYLALQQTNQQLLDCDINTELAGSTLVAVFVYMERLFCFNVGDSRAILLRQVKTNFCKQQDKDQKKLPVLSHKQPHQEYEWQIFPLSDDQKPERPDEKERILKSGGRVFAQTNEHGQQLGPARVWMKEVMMPGLAMTRSFGDKAGIKAGTNAQPELLEHALEKCDKMLVIASDGVWEYMQNDEVLKAVVPGYLKEDIQISGESLLKRSVDMWSKMNFARDDITFIIVKIGLPEK